MSLNSLKQDLRNQKTKNSLNDSMFVLLEKQNFRKVTVKDICEEAMISRATFYSYFVDKYDLLKYCLENSQLANIEKNETYENLEKTVNQIISQNKKIIKNILEEADNETTSLVFDTILTSFGIYNNMNSNENTNLKYIVFSNIFAGGIICYLLWHVENKFPLELMNIYLYDIIKTLYTWESRSQ